MLTTIPYGTIQSPTIKNIHLQMLRYSYMHVSTSNLSDVQVLFHNDIVAVNKVHGHAIKLDSNSYLWCSIAFKYINIINQL